MTAAPAPLRALCCVRCRSVVLVRGRHCWRCAGVIASQLKLRKAAA